MNQKLSRRDFARSSCATGLAGSLLACEFTQNIRTVHSNWIETPKQPFGIMSGEVTNDSAVIWGRSDIDSRMIVEWDTDARFKNPRMIQGPLANALSDWTARCFLQGLPSASDLFFQVSFENAGGRRTN